LINLVKQAIIGHLVILNTVAVERILDNFECKID